MKKVVIIYSTNPVTGTPVATFKRVSVIKWFYIKMTDIVVGLKKLICTNKK